jgi:pyruvate kinase
MKKTKIVCTIGPKTESEEMLTKMLDAGMNVMRLNSHGDYAEHGQRIKNLRNVMSKTGKSSNLLDTKGPKSVPSNWKAVTTFLKAGQTFTFTTDKSVVGNNEIVAVYEGFTKDLSVGNTVLVDDGLIGMEAHKSGNKVICKVLNNGDLAKTKALTCRAFPSTASTG